jgi:hypothetical protein
MQQLSLLRLFGFIAFLVTYTAFLDPSFQQFISAVEKLKDMNIHYMHVISSVSWLIGMWGLVLFLNSPNNVLRNSIWILFLITSLINFCYYKIFKSSFSFSNINKIDEMFLRLSEVGSMEFLQFIGLSAAIILFAKYIKPLNISYNRAFVMILAATTVLNLIINSGNNIPMPSIYAVIGVIIYKYTLLISGIGHLKKV